MKLKNYILILFLGITSTIMVSCGGSSRMPLTEDQLVYAGVWEAPGDLMIRISADGGGDFKFSGSNVTGGTATFTETGFKIGLFGIEKDFTINEVPFDEEGNTYMVVEGIKFTKAD